MVLVQPYCGIDTSPIQGKQNEGIIKYDYLVYGVGAETQTFNIPGVKENSCFMKELRDAEKVGHFVSALLVMMRPV